MYLSDTVVGIIFFSQTAFGVLGNSFFLWFYGFTPLCSQRSRPIDLILVQLTLANTIVLFLHGCPSASFYLGKGPFLGNAGCKMVFYLHRISRGFSICSTCLLSVLQAVTISPCSSTLAKLKVRFLKSVKPSCLVCWIFSIIIEVYVPIYITELKSNDSSHRDELDLSYCYWVKTFKELSLLPTVRDIFFVVGMVCTSGYMVFLLVRHHQRVQHIHSTCLSPRSFPEVSTCLLSVLQAVTISPCSSTLAKLKVRFLKSVKPSCLVCWIFSIIIEVYVPIYITELKSNDSSHRDELDLSYCYWVKTFKELSLLPTLRDIFFVVGMVCTSGYMVFLLIRHHQRVQHIHSTCLSPRSFPEVKATQTILLLVGIFVSAYFVSCGFILCKVYVTHSGAWVMVVGTFVGLCFPAFSPFLLIHRNTQSSQACCDPWQSPSLYSVITDRICESIHLLCARFL